MFEKHVYIHSLTRSFILNCLFFYLFKENIQYLFNFTFCLIHFAELCDAATRIQAAFRGHLARKEAGPDELKDDLQEITKKVAEELDIDLNDPELHRAATKIQASFRGHKVRKDTTS